MSQNTQKILAVVLLVFLLIAIPLTVWYGQQQQQTEQKASTQVWNGGDDTCNKVHVAFESEVPACSSAGVATDTYTTTVRLTSKDGQSHQVSYLFESFWCKDAGELGDGVNPTSCIKRVKTDSKTITVGAGAGVTVASVEQKASSYGFGEACGVYQTDFSFTVDGTSCRFGYSALDPSPAHPVLAAGYCNTNKTCSPPTATPSPTIPVTPPTATPTLPVTPPTATPTTPVTPPTGTPSPGPSSSPSPTTTPGPTSTPVPPTTTPKPTLPPTGPGSLVITIGLIGAAAAIVGTLVLLAL